MIQTTDKSKISSASVTDKETHLDCRSSNKSVSSQRKADVTREKICKDESTDGSCQLENDLKCATVCSNEKQSRTDRRQRREKRPDVQLYVPKPKQQPQRDLDGSSAAADASLKSSDRKTSPQSECASDQKCGSAESCKAGAAAVPPSSTRSAANTSGSFESRDNSEIILQSQSHQLKSELTVECCSSDSIKSSSVSLPCSSGDLPSSGSKTAEWEEISDPVHGRIKRKVSKPVKSQNIEPKQAASEYFDSSAALRNSDGDKIGKPCVRSEGLDWDFDGEFEYNRDGVSWGDLPPPSDHELSLIHI